MGTGTATGRRPWRVGWSADAAECRISRRPTISAYRQLARPRDPNRPSPHQTQGGSPLVDRRDTATVLIESVRAASPASWVVSRRAGEPSSAVCGQPSPTRCPRPSTRFYASWASTTGPRSGACPTSAGRSATAIPHGGRRSSKTCSSAVKPRFGGSSPRSMPRAATRVGTRSRSDCRPGTYMRDGAPGDALAGRGDRSGLARRPLPEAQAGRRPESRVAAEAMVTAVAAALADQGMAV
jgi:hypothetical protein